MRNNSFEIPSDDAPTSTHYGGGVNAIIFIIATYLGLLILSAPFANFRLFSLLAIFVTFAIYRLISPKHLCLTFKNPTEYIIIFGFLFTISVLINAGIWIYEQDYTTNNPHSSFGSIETGRYSNISSYIITHDSIPRIKQNYGQSIITAALGWISFLNGPLTLFLILTFSKTLLLLSLYELIRNYRGVLLSISFSVSLLFLGQSVIFSSVINYDSGTPIAVNGYFDAIFSFLTLYLYIYINIVKIEKRRLIISFILYLNWIFIAPQNIILVSVYNVFLLFTALKIEAFKNLLLILSTLVFSYFFGGFFLGNVDQDVIKSIPGLDILLSKFLLKLNFGMDYLIFDPFNYPGFAFQHISNPPVDYGNLTLQETTNIFIARLTTILEINFLTLYVFFTGLGMYFKNSLYKNFFGFYFCAFILFACVCIFEVVDHKWQMSRFIMPFAIISSFTFIFYLSSVARRDIFYYCNLMIFLYLLTYNSYASLARIKLFLFNSPMFFLNKLIFGF